VRCADEFSFSHFKYAFPDFFSFIPALFWDHLARASTLGLLGNIEDGRKSAAELLKLKPDFPERGRIQIRHYIKFEDIVERVIEGLNAAGIEVE